LLTEKIEVENQAAQFFDLIGDEPVPNRPLSGAQPRLRRKPARTTNADKSWRRWGSESKPVTPEFNWKCSDSSSA